MRAGEKTRDAGSGRLYLEILADSGPEAVTPAGLGFSAAADVPPIARIDGIAAVTQSR